MMKCVHWTTGLKHQGERDDYRFLLQTTRPLSPPAFPWARQKIATNPKTKVCKVKVTNPYQVNPLFQALF